VEVPWAEGEVFARSLGTPEQNHGLFAGIVREMRRAVYFVVAQPGTDDAQLGFAGHGSGAHAGGMFVGVEPRLHVVALVAGAPGLTDVAVANSPYPAGEALEHSRCVTVPIDPTRFVAGRHRASGLLHFGERDIISGTETARRLADAASEPKQVRWHDRPPFPERGGEAIPGRVAARRARLGVP